MGWAGNGFSPGVSSGLRPSSPDHDDLWVLECAHGCFCFCCCQGSWPFCQLSTLVFLAALWPPSCCFGSLPCRLLSSLVTLQSLLLLFSSFPFFFLCSPGWPETQKSAYLCLLRAGIKGVITATQLLLLYVTSSAHSKSRQEQTEPSVAQDRRGSKGDSSSHGSQTAPFPSVSADLQGNGHEKECSK